MPDQDFDSWWRSVYDERRYLGSPQDVARAAWDAARAPSAEVEKLQRAFDEVVQERGEWVRETMEAEKQRDALRTAAGKLAEALAFYADPDTYHIEILGRCPLGDDQTFDEDAVGRQDPVGDFGVKARAALAAWKEASGE